jgi:hypothetical protein
VKGAAAVTQHLNLTSRVGLDPYGGIMWPNIPQ